MSPESSVNSKVVICVLNPGQTPADNGRTVHALKLAGALKEAGALVKVVFEGQGVTWIPRFVSRGEDSHPFVKNYGPAFDAIREEVHACNMCTKRFDAREAILAADVPIIGEGREHIDLAPYILKGWQVLNF